MAADSIDLASLRPTRTARQDSRRDEQDVGRDSLDRQVQDRYQAGQECGAQVHSSIRYGMGYLCHDSTLGFPDRSCVLAFAEQCSSRSCTDALDNSVIPRWPTGAISSNVLRPFARPASMPVCPLLPSLETETVFLLSHTTKRRKTVGLTGSWSLGVL